MGVWNGLAFWFMVGICLVSMSSKFSYRLERTMPKFHRWVPKLFIHHKKLVVLVLFVGTLVRIWQFGSIPAGFNQDGAMGAVDALALAQYGTDRLGMRLPAHFTAWGYGQMSVLLSYLSVPFIALFGLNPFTARIVVLITSLAALWVLYLVGKILWGKNAALAILAIAAINPWQMMQSRWALDCNLFPHFFLFGFYFLLKGFEKRNWKLAASMVFFALSMYAYGIAWYAVPLFLLVTAGYCWWKKILPLKSISLMAGAFILVAWPIFGVILVNLFKLPTISTWFFTIPYFPGTSRTGDLLLFSNNFSQQLQTNFSAMMQVAFLQKPDLPWNTIPDFGPLYLFSMPVLVMSWIFLMKNRVQNKQKKQFSETQIGQVVLFIWLGISLFSGILINQVNVNRLNIIFYPLIIFVGYGCYQVAKHLRIAGITLILIYSVAFGAFTVTYFTKTADELATAFYDGFGEALEAVDVVDYDVVVVTNWTQSQGSWWVSEPLTLFHDQVDALYYQGKKELSKPDGTLMLPYKERYRYANIVEWPIDPLSDTVYVVHKGEEGTFDPNRFELVPDGDYFAVIPKHLLP